MNLLSFWRMPAIKKSKAFSGDSGFPRKWYKIDEPWRDMTHFMAKRSACNSSRPTPRQTSCKKWLLPVYFFSEANMFSKKYFLQFIRRHSSLLSDRWSPGLWQVVRSLYRCETSRTSNCWSMLFVSESWMRLKNVLELNVDTNIMIKNTTAVTIGEKKHSALFCPGDCYY